MAERRRVRLGSVRVRTTVAATTVVGAALVVGAVVLVGVLRNSLQTNVRTAAELRAQDVVLLMEGGDAPDELAVDDDDDSLVQVVDVSGAVVAASSNVAGKEAIATMAPGESRTLHDVPVDDEEGDPYLVVARGTNDGRHVVLVARTLEPVGESTQVVVRLLLAGIPGLLLLVAATTWIVTGRALRPVEDIRREVAAISGAALDRRVPEPTGDDEIARLARTMNAMLDRLQGSRDRQRRFVSDASHELRSPIATIRHHLEVALAHPEQTTLGELGPDLLAEDLRMERLVADLLLLARADEDSLARHHHAVDLDDLVLAEADRVRQQGRMRVDTSRVSAGRVQGDRAHLARLVRNLVDNAERHAASAMTISLQRAGDTVELTVADDGEGIAPEDAARVFERFTRLDEARARDTGGAGLGLSIVAEVARAHGGTVRLVPSDVGACFVVVLPSEGLV